MKKVSYTHLLGGALIVMALIVAACTPEQKNTARAVAASAIDAACNNLPNMDAQFATVAPRANAGAKATYQSAKATLVSICNNRPLDRPEQQMAALGQAIASITTILTPLIAGN